MTDRIRPALVVYVFGVLGIFLAAAPWTAVWEEGTRFLLPTAVSAWARSGWVRGAVSGLGLLDLGVAAAEGAGLLRLMRRGAGRDEA